jgi:hypothetical protein
VVDDERITAVSWLWQAHLQTPFPPETSRRRDRRHRHGDARRRHRWLPPHLLHHAGQPASKARTRVTACLNNLNRVLPLLTNPPEADYYRRLRDLANLICDLPDWDPNPRASGWKWLSNGSGARPLTRNCDRTPER